MTDDKNTLQFKADVSDAVKVLKSGGLILYPTDTIWGIGCDATNPEAVARIYALKQRVQTKSMLVLMANETMIERYVSEPEEIAFQLMAEAVNPITVIFDKATGLAPNLVSEDGSVGIRIPRECYCEGLLRGLRKPIVSTSANISGEPAASVFGEISQAIIDGVDYVAKYRRDDTQRTKSSSIIKISGGGLFKIIRQ